MVYNFNLDSMVIVDSTQGENKHNEVCVIDLQSESDNIYLFRNEYAIIIRNFELNKSMADSDNLNISHLAERLQLLAYYKIIEPAKDINFEEDFLSQLPKNLLPITVQRDENDSYLNSNDDFLIIEVPAMGGIEEDLYAFSCSGPCGS